MAGIATMPSVWFQSEREQMDVWENMELGLINWINLIFESTHAVVSFAVL